MRALRSSSYLFEGLDVGIDMTDGGSGEEYRTFIGRSTFRGWKVGMDTHSRRNVNPLTAASRTTRRLASFAGTNF
jgi:hypothetical protein